MVIIPSIYGTVLETYQYLSGSNAETPSQNHTETTIFPHQEEITTSSIEYNADNIHFDSSENINITALLRQLAALLQKLHGMTHAHKAITSLQQFNLYLKAADLIRDTGSHRIIMSWLKVGSVVVAMGIQLFGPNYITVHHFHTISQGLEGFTSIFSQSAITANDATNKEIDGLLQASHAVQENFSKQLDILSQNLRELIHQALKEIPDSQRQAIMSTMMR